MFHYSKTLFKVHVSRVLFLQCTVQDKFIAEVQAANESMAYDLSEKLGELSEKVYQRGLLLEKVKKNTPCDCAEEFTRIEDYKDKVDEAYDFLLIRFDTIDREESSYTMKVCSISDAKVIISVIGKPATDFVLQTTYDNYQDYMGYWHRMVGPTNDPLDGNGTE